MVLGQNRWGLLVLTEQSVTVLLGVFSHWLGRRTHLGVPKQTCRVSELGWTSLKRSQSMQSALHEGINKATLHPDVAIRQRVHHHKQPRVSGTACRLFMWPKDLFFLLHFISLFCLGMLIYILGWNWASLVFDCCMSFVGSGRVHSRLTSNSDL